METEVSLSFTGVLPFDHFKRNGRLPEPAVYERQLSAKAATEWRETLISALGVLLGKYTGSKEVRIGLLPATTLSIGIGNSSETRFGDTFREVRRLLSGDMIGAPDPPEGDPRLPDLILHCARERDSILIRAEYDCLSYTEDTVGRFLTHLDTLLCSATEDPDRLLAAISIVSEEEGRLIKEVFNATAVQYENAAASIKKLLSEKAGRHPQAIAVLAPEGTLTYAAFDERAAKLASVLHTKGVTARDIVAVMAERSINTLVGIYAVVKCGAAYLPIDAGYPPSRKEYMLKDSKARFLLHEGRSGVSSDSDHLITISLDQGEESKDRYDGGPDIGGHSLAYVIYTSGSTGEPKGVMIEQQSLVNRLNWMQRKYPIGEGDVILHKTSFSFDVSVWELFWWALTGASVCLLEPQAERFCDSIIDYIHNYKVTIIHFVPSMLAVFLDFTEAMDEASRLIGLRRVFSSGEALPGAVVEKFYRLLPWCRLINLYGPTEATIDVTYYDCPPIGATENIPIGRPIDNMQLYIVDSDMCQLPVGVNGELCIGGVGLARGYLNKDELTRRQFVRPAWFEGILYKTGDIARWLPDGNIVFLGRRDAQVKVRGYRIETGEIEYQLRNHPQVKHAIVIARPEAGSGEKVLIAYILSDARIASQELVAFLSRNLPDFMIPAYFVPIDNIPLTANHKLDKQALPDPHMMAL